MKASRTRATPTPSIQRRSGEQRRGGEHRKPDATAHKVAELLEGASATSTASDYTRDQTRAFIHSLRPLQGVADIGESAAYQKGRTVLERLADSAVPDPHGVAGTEVPQLRLTPEQCAEVCEYLSSIEPFDPVNWWNDTPDKTSHVCGFHAVMDAMAKSLRSPEASEPDRPDPPARAEAADDDEPSTVRTMLTTLQPLDDLLGAFTMVQNVVGCVIATMDAEADFKEPWAEQVRATLRLAELQHEALTEEGIRVYNDLSKLIRNQPISDPARLIRAAVAGVEKLYQEAKEGSNDEREYEAAIDSLKDALGHIKFVA